MILEKLSAKMTAPKMSSSDESSPGGQLHAVSSQAHNDAALLSPASESRDDAPSSVAESLVPATSSEEEGVTDEAPPSSDEDPECAAMDLDESAAAGAAVGAAAADETKFPATLAADSEDIVLDDSEPPPPKSARKRKVAAPAVAQTPAPTKTPKDPNHPKRPQSAYMCAHARHVPRHPRHPPRGPPQARAGCHPRHPHNAGAPPPRPLARPQRAALAPRSCPSHHTPPRRLPRQASPAVLFGASPPALHCAVTSAAAARRFFCAEQRKGDGYAGLAPKDVMRELGAAWKELAFSSHKEPYERLAKVRRTPMLQSRTL